jgi:hypothetical protein
MKKMFFLPVLAVYLFISVSAAPHGFWDLYISGPDSQCALGPSGYGTWTIEDTYLDPVDPNNQYEWFIMDDEATQEGYPMAGYPFGRPAGVTDRTLNAAPSWGTGGNDVIITCKITNGSNVRYEGIDISGCE